MSRARDAWAALAVVLALALAAVVLSPATGAARDGTSRERSSSQPAIPPVVAEHVGAARGPAVAVRIERDGVVPATSTPPRAGRGEAPSRRAWAAEPAVAFGFDAIARIGPNWPADPTGALGRSWFLTAVNTSYALYDLAGVPAIGPNALGSLGFSLPRGTVLFDPKVVYDQYLDHFVLAFLAVNDARQRSWILLVSVPDATATDPSTWCGARIVGDRTAGDGRQFVDYPGLGYDRDRVVVTTNMFDFDGHAFRAATVLAFPKTRLYDCGRTLTFATFAGASTRSPSGAPGFTLQPSVTVGSGRSLYLTSFEPGRPNVVVLWRLAESRSGLALKRVALKVPRVRIAPYGTQAGGDLRTPNTWWDPGDLRLVSTFADLPHGRIYTAHAIAKDVGPDVGDRAYVESVVRWYEIRAAGNLKRSAVSRIGTIGSPQTDAGWPALATDVNGNLFVTYARASAVAGEYLSAWIAEIPPGGTRATIALLRAGTARMEAVRGPERWGDFNAMSRDPADGTFVAAVNQVAVSDGIGPSRDWQQTVHVVSDAVMP